MTRALGHDLGHLAVLLCTCLACDFFHELKDSENATESEGEETSADEGGNDNGNDDGNDDAQSSSSTGDEDTGDTDAPCTLELDDRCASQDVLESCDRESGFVTPLDCSAACGGYVNFSCIATPSGQHACWCVQAGKQKTYSCTELEACLATCPALGENTCTSQCFARTMSTTIRLFGALVHCAGAVCEDICNTHPEQCAPCMQAAMAGTGAGCTLERAVCDSDVNDDPEP